MKYNPETHHRKSIRLKYYDYSTEGIYFITICTQNRKHLFWKKNCRGGACSAQKTNLNFLGEIIKNEWINLSHRYSNVRLGEYVIMPNHLHGIIFLDNFVDFGRSKPRPYNRKYNLRIQININDIM